MLSLADFGAFTAIAPGTWIEIYGTNFATDSVTWSGSDFKNNVGPTTLGGVSVSVGGQPAYISSVSHNASYDQIDAQVPSNVGAGSQNIVVTTSAGSTAPYSITVNTTQPGLDAGAAFQVGGKQYVVVAAGNAEECELLAFALPSVN